MTSTDRLAEMAAEIERLRARVTELEAIVTVGHGTMGTLQPGTGPSGDEIATITHGHAPSAPPYDKPLSVIDINIITARALKTMSEPDPDDE